MRRTKYLCISVLTVAVGPRRKLAGCKSALTPTQPPTPHTVVNSTDRSKAVGLVFFLLFVAFRSFVVHALLSVFFFFFFFFGFLFVFLFVFFSICVVMLAL